MFGGLFFKIIDVHGIRVYILGTMWFSERGGGGWASQTRLLEEGDDIWGWNLQAS